MRASAGATTVSLAGLDIRAMSVGGIETCIEVPSYHVAFDVGRCPESVVSCPTILFTHSHIDHMGGIAMHTATRALRGMSPPTYVVPPESSAAVGKLFEAWRLLDGSELEHHLQPIGPGDSLTLPNKLVARPFRSPHRIPCQGYGLWRVHHKLLPEYVGKSGGELRALRGAGTPVTQPVETPELAFTGDTRIEVVEREEIVRRARRLVMEVTFLDDRVSVERARATGHVHLFEVAERAELFENEAILFTHFSARYSPRQILRALDDTLPPELRERVTPLLGGPA